MPVPSPRNPIRPARGNKADLLTNIANLFEGELCYAIDEDRMYVVEGGALVAITSGPSSGDVAPVEIISAVAGEALVYNQGKWRNGGNMDGGNF